MWEGVGDQTELQHIDPHSIGYNRVSFPFSWAAQLGPGGPASLGAGFLYHILSPTGLVSKTATAQSGAWGLPLLGAGFLYSILSPTDWISCALSYIIVQRPPSSCGRHNRIHSTRPQWRLYSDIPWADAPVINTNAFPILTAQPSRRSIYNMNSEFSFS